MGTVPAQSRLDVPEEEERQLAGFSVSGLLICMAGVPHLVGEGACCQLVLADVLLDLQRKHIACMTVDANCNQLQLHTCHMCCDITGVHATCGVTSRVCMQAETELLRLLVNIFAGCCTSRQPECLQLRPLGST